MNVPPSRAATDAAELRRLADELFITTDQKDWTAARALFAEGPIEVDMSSLVGGGPVELTADQLIADLRAGLHRGKLSHHMATNYRIAVRPGRTLGAWPRLEPGPRAAGWSGRAGDVGRTTA